MKKISEMQARLATAKERNRANNERRQQLMAEIKEKFGCSTIDELKTKLQELETEVAELQGMLDRSLAEAEAELVALEEKVGVR